MRVFGSSPLNAVQLLLLAGALLTVPLAAEGATVFVDPVDENPSEFVLEVGQTLDLALVLQLDSSEQASVFEGHFELVESGGAGPLVSVVIEADPPTFDSECDAPQDPRSCTWDGASADIVEFVARLSLFSDNLGGERRLGTLEVSGLSPGTFKVVLLEETLLQRDVPGPPFLEDVPLTPSGGIVLARIVVPEPDSVPLVAAALFTIAALRKRHAAGVANHGAL